MAELSRCPEWTPRLNFASNSWQSLSAAETGEPGVVQLDEPRRVHRPPERFLALVAVKKPDREKPGEVDPVGSACPVGQFPEFSGVSSGLTSGVSGTFFPGGAMDRMTMPMIWEVSVVAISPKDSFRFTCLMV